MKQLFLVIIFGFIFVNISLAQDVSLVDLKTNPNLASENLEQLRSRSTDIDVFYIIDTLQLPFVDDFSKNFQLRYRDYSSGMQFVKDSAQSIYRFGNEVRDSIVYNKEATHTYFYSSVTNTVDTIENDSVLIYIYDTDLEEFLLLTYGWEAEDYYYNNGVLVHTEVLEYDTVLRDSVWYQLYVSDTSKHWLDNGVWINSTMGIEPPTIGVATFDGVDSIGHPYDFNNEGSYGPADYLTSYPLNLDNKEDVKISFYYQPQGYGNEPEGRDSLILEFFGNGNWNYVWSVAGKAVADFEYVAIPITDDTYLYNGFQFRFRNYSTLSGSLDHWHIDYVYLDEDRAGNSSEVKDFGFKEVERSLLKNYQAMPYQHYIENLETHMKDNATMDLVNFSSLDLSGITDYKVFDGTNYAEVFDAVDLNFVTFNAFSEEEKTHSIMEASNEFLFPNSGENIQTYKVQYISNSNTIQSSDINPYNDTITINQVFDTYYAYDDGSPESGFAVAGVGATVAYKFSIESTDTLTGVLINFLEMFENVDNTYNIKVWMDLRGEPSTIVYESEDQFLPTFEFQEDLVKPLSFTRHELDTLLILPAGEYYFGWTQQKLNMFFVGFDMNNDASDKMLYNLGTGWTNYEAKGALMLRPEFGNSVLKPIISTNLNETTQQKIKLYPNPASEYIRIEVPDATNLKVEVFDIYGKLVMSKIIDDNDNIDFGGYSNGFYLISLSNDNFNHQEKILIQH